MATAGLLIRHSMTRVEYPAFVVWGDLYSETRIQIQKMVGD